jgi:hypothetical protein
MPDPVTVLARFMLSAFPNMRNTINFLIVHGSQIGARRGARAFPSPMTTSVHLGTELLERYSMKGCSEQEASVVEEHLLVCQRCRSSFDGAKEFVGLVKRAFGETAS